MCSTIELLQQIASNTSSNDSVWIAGISAFSALLGAGIGAGVSYLGVRSNRMLEEKKLKAGLIATERLRWLRELRERFSTFFTQLDMQYNLIKRPVQKEDAKNFQKTLDEYSLSISEQSHLINLMLNPEKPEQFALRKAINDAKAFFLKCLAEKGLEAKDFDDSVYAEIQERALGSITGIGIETWKQVKNLE